MIVSPEQREAIGRLQYTRDGKMLVECLHATVAKLYEASAMNDDMQTVRLFQGSIRAHRELISLLTPVSSQ